MKIKTVLDTSVISLSAINPLTIYSKLSFNCNVMASLFLIVFL